MTEEVEFSRWMEEIDGCVRLLAGLSVHDLPDFGFRDAFRDERDPGDVALEILSEAGWSDE